MSAGLDALLGVLLESAALAVVIAGGTAAIALAVTSFFAARSPATRADVAFVAALAPAIIVLVGLATALSPSILTALGDSSADHCPAHVHHPHLCVLHFSGLRPPAALLGAIAVAAFTVRAGAFAVRRRRLAQGIAGLEALGAPAPGGAFPLVRLPGDARICHAVGVRRRRVLVSGALADRLSTGAWAALVAHEEEHLRRRDPVALVLVETALLVVPPPLSGALARVFREAAERACDHGAARVVGDGVAVAEGLIEAARILGPRAALPGVAAAAEGALETRVRDLIDLAAPVQAPRPAFGFAAALGALALFVAVGALQRDAVHHALETLLFYLS